MDVDSDADVLNAVRSMQIEIEVAMRLAVMDGSDDAVHHPGRLSCYTDACCDFFNRNWSVVQSAI